MSERICIIYYFFSHVYSPCARLLDFISDIFISLVILFPFRRNLKKMSKWQDSIAVQDGSLYKQILIYDVKKRKPKKKKKNEYVFFDTLYSLLFSSFFYFLTCFLFRPSFLTFNHNYSALYQMLNFLLFYISHSLFQSFTSLAQL